MFFTTRLRVVVLLQFLCISNDENEDHTPKYCVKKKEYSQCENN